MKNQRLARDESGSIRILHITDCMNAGTKEAIISLVTSNSKQEHHLLWQSRADAPGPSSKELQKYFMSNIFWQHKNVFSEIRQMNKSVNSLQPDFIHLHSSRAGILGRLFIYRYKILYTSHGFGFQRRDINKFTRYVFYLIEKTLGKRRFHYVAIWPAELEIAREQLKLKDMGIYPLEIMRKCIKTKYDSINKFSETKMQARVLIVGRITAAKDPEFAIEVQKIISKKQSHAIYWIGAEESSNTEILERMKQSGIKVSGWLPKKDIMKAIKACDVVAITSSWEAGPLVFYEALSLGKPSVTRPILAFKSLGIEGFERPKQFADRVVELLNSSIQRHAQVQNHIEAINEYLGREFNLKEIYSNASE